MASQKTKVIEYLFFKYWSADTRTLSKRTMSLFDVQKAIEECNKKYRSNLSTKNPANFMKDIVRGQSASKIWPEKLKRLKFTAIQRTGTGDVFEFIPYKTGQTEPFPDVYKPKSNTPRFKVQSISMPLAVKALGRSDEPWLIQTAVILRVIESHFAIVSELPVIQITHLQMSVKLRKTEIDALYLATFDARSKHDHAIITCEAKQARERILEHQIVNQAKAAFEVTKLNLVVPIGLRAIKGIGFYVVEFEPVSRDSAANLEELKVSKEALFELTPPVPGI